MEEDGEAIFVAASAAAAAAEEEQDDDGDNDDVWVDNNPNVEDCCCCLETCLLLPTIYFRKGASIYSIDIVFVLYQCLTGVGVAAANLLIQNAGTRQHGVGFCALDSPNPFAQVGAMDSPNWRGLLRRRAS